MKPGAGPFISEIRVRPLRAPMTEPFEIAGGAQTEVANLLVSLRLSDGTVGFGESAPSPQESGKNLNAARKRLLYASKRIEGSPVSSLESLSRRIAELCGGHGPARAGLEMAVLDAWSRRHRTPLWVYFGGAQSRVATDVTVPILPATEAGRAARRIAGSGVSRIKIKVGRDLGEDEARVRAVSRAAPKAGLLLDANQGYRPSEAVRLVERLARSGIRPLLFEQPVSKEDLDGLAEVQSRARVPVAADESVASLEDVWRLARRKAVSVVNLKFMKFGVWEAWAAARAARAAGLGLMMGGMVESRLSMGCAAHFAGGFGGFGFVDLDTPLWFAKDPMRGGLQIGPGGVYDLSRVRAGIGVRPLAADRS